MSNALDIDKPTKVNADFRSGSSSADKMGDHFIVVEGKTDQICKGKVTSTTFHYFDPGTSHKSKGTSPSNTLRVVYNRLVGTHINKGLPIVVTSIRPTKLKCHMLQFIKKSLFAIFCILIFVNCSGQATKKDFDLFLSRFTGFNFPVNPTEFIVNREAKLRSINISKKDYDEFLRVNNDVYWRFKSFFEYRYGGKCKLSNSWFLFYSRNYVPDDINKQKSEVILATFTFDGRMISSLPVAGSYGDSLTFTSTIKNSQQITINYIQYFEDKEYKYSKHYFIDGKGLIKENN